MQDNGHANVGLPTESIMGLLPIAIYTTDRDGLITYFNEPAVDLWGVRPVLGESRWCGSWRIYTTGGEILPHDRCPMAVCLTEGHEVAGAEIVVERPDGQRKSVIVHPRPIRDGADRLTGAVNTLIDVSAIRDAEQARLASDSFARQILESSRDCIKVLDLEGRLQSINPWGCQALEVDDPERIRGRCYYDFWSGEDRDAVKAAAGQALRTGSSRSTMPFTTPSGRNSIWELAFSVSRNGAGEPAGFVVISRDITEKQRAQDTLARHLARQTAMVEIGTLALAEDDLQPFLDRTAAIVGAVLDCPLVKVLEFADSADRLLLRAGIGWNDGVVGQASVGIERASQAGFTLSTGGPVVVEDLASETRFSGPQLLTDHGVRSGMSTVISGSEGRPFGVLGVHCRDLRSFEGDDVAFLSAVANILASRARLDAASRHRDLMMREMAHRSGNLLQLANSVFHQTLRFTPEVDRAKRVFSDRLAAMARTNMTISKGGWQKSSFGGLVRDALEPFLDRIRLSGRDVLLPSELCFDFGLILHELSTNSSKYGAFSGASGEVRLDWDLVDGEHQMPRFVLQWRDTSAQGTGRGNGTGFGTRLLGQLVEQKWKGTVETSAGPGYRCVITVPIAPDLALHG